MLTMDVSIGCGKMLTMDVSIGCKIVLGVQDANNECFSRVQEDADNGSDTGIVFSTLGSWFKSKWAFFANPS
jgi:hypothetical protein